MRFKLIKFDTDIITRILASFFSGLLALLFSLIYIKLRFNINDGSIYNAIKVLCVSIFLLFTPLFINIFLRKVNCKKSWFLSESAFFIYCLFIIIIFNNINNYIKLFILLIMGLSGCFSLIYLVIYFIKNNKIYKLLQIIIFIILFIILCFFIISLAWSDRTHPFFIENFVNNNKIHQDTTYFMSISNLIKTHGFPCTGVDGIIHLKYHNFTFWLFMFFSNFLNMNIISFYLIGFQVIFIALFFKYLLYLIIGFREINCEDSNFNIVLLLFLIFGFVNIFSYKNIFIIVESQIVGFTLFFIFLLLLLHSYRGYYNKKYKNKIEHALLLCIIIPLFLNAATYSKLSIGFFSIIIYIYIYIRFKLFIKRINVISLLITFISLYIFYYYFIRNRNVSINVNNFYDVINIYSQIFFKALLFYSILFFMVYLFIYFKTKLYNKFISNFILFFSFIFVVLLVFLEFNIVNSAVLTILNLYNKNKMKLFSDVLFWSFLWVFIFFMIGQLKLNSFNKLIHSFKKIDTFYIEIIFILFMISFLPSFLFLSIPDITFRYFTYTVSFFALILISGNFSFKINLNKLLAVYGLRKIISILKTFKVNEIFKLKYFINIKKYLAVLFKKRIFSLKIITCIIISLLILNIILKVTARKVKNVIASYNNNIAQNKNYFDNNGRLKLLRILQKLDKIPVDEKRKTLIFIPQSNRMFWDINSDYKIAILWNYSAPFIVPAFTGIAMINGKPPVLQKMINIKDYERAISKKYIDFNTNKFLMSIYKKDELSGYYYLKNDLTNYEKIKAFKILLPVYKNTLSGFSYFYYDNLLEPQYEDFLDNPGPLCKEVREKGFEEVIVIYQDGDNILTKKILCK